MTKTFLATVSVYPEGGNPIWDEGAGKTTTTSGAAIVSGVPASVQVLSGQGGNPININDDLVKITGYLVRMSLSGTGVDDIPIGSILKVDTCPDPDLVNRSLRITDVVRSSLRFERMVLAQLDD